MTTCSEKEAPFCAAVSLKRQLLFWDLDSKGIRFMIHELKNTYNSAFWDSKYLSSLQRAPTVFLYNCSGIENMRTSLHNFLEKMERFLTLKFFFTRTHMIRVFNIHHRIFVSFYEYKQNSQLTTSQWFISQWQDFFCWWFNEICCDGLFTGTTDTGGYGLNPPPPPPHPTTLRKMTEPTFALVSTKKADSGQVWFFVYVQRAQFWFSTNQIWAQMTRS